MLIEAVSATSWRNINYSIDFGRSFQQFFVRLLLTMRM